MNKLNGWKRIGIVTSVAWILGSPFYTPDDTRYIHEMINAAHEQCHENKTEFDVCERQAQDSFARMLPGERLETALIAFVPVPLAWGAVYLFLFLAGWIRRGGFQAGTVQ